MSNASMIHRGEDVVKLFSGFSVDTQSTDVYPLRLRIKNASRFLDDLGENVRAPCRVRHAGDFNEGIDIAPVNSLFRCLCARGFFVDHNDIWFTKGIGSCWPLCRSAGIKITLGQLWRVGRRIPVSSYKIVGNVIEPSSNFCFGHFIRQRGQVSSLCVLENFGASISKFLGIELGANWPTARLEDIPGQPIRQ